MSFLCVEELIKEKTILNWEIMFIVLILQFIYYYEHLNAGDCLLEIKVHSEIV